MKVTFRVVRVDAAQTMVEMGKTEGGEALYTQRETRNVVLQGDNGQGEIRLSLDSERAWRDFEQGGEFTVELRKVKA